MNRLQREARELARRLHEKLLFAPAGQQPRLVRLHGMAWARCLRRGV